MAASDYRILYSLACIAEGPLLTLTILNASTSRRKCTSVSKATYPLSTAIKATKSPKGLSYVHTVCVIADLQQGSFYGGRAMIR